MWESLCPERQSLYWNGAPGSGVCVSLDDSVNNIFMLCLKTSKKYDTNDTKVGAGNTWWHHQMESFYVLLVLSADNSPVTGEFPTQRPLTRSFDVFFDLRLNKQLSKPSWGWWFETPSCPLWCHCNDFYWRITFWITVNAEKYIFFWISTSWMTWSNFLFGM